jgi:hypothetical protein
MSLSRYLIRTGRHLMTVGVLTGLLSACAALGPAAIRNGRLNYNQAITETNNQQMLMAVLHIRYQEIGSLLAVSSVTANIRVTAGTEIQMGFGDGENYSGNLIPFSASTVYEENPTISYLPATGEKYARQLMSPIPVSTVAQIAGSFIDPAPVYDLLVSSVNGIYNPDFLFSPDIPDPRFSRFVSIMSLLTRMHRLHWVQDLQHAGNFSVVIDHYAPTYSAEVNELLSLLGLSAPRDHSAPLILPVSQALDGREAKGIGLTTRSVYRLAEVLSAAVELPEQDRDSGVTVDYPPVGPAGQALRVHYATTRPEDAAIAVQYRGGWFYIKDNDRATKRFFRFLGTLWSIKIAESTANSTAAPMLTIPVSR